MRSATLLSILYLALTLGFLSLPLIASAHEVYILDAATIARDVATPSPNPLDAYRGNEFQFFFWGIIAIITVSTTFCMSIFSVFEKWADPWLDRLKPYAPLVERLTLGISLMVFAYNSALFGPELPLVGIYGNFTPLIQIALFATGALITLGLFTRAAALVVAFMALFSIPVHGWYMLTYTAYFVVALVVFIMGSGRFSLDRLFKRYSKSGVERFARTFAPYEMLVLRIGFGISVIVAAVFAKFLHTNLALDVIRIYHLTDYFRFQPLFIVFGALIIETLIGLFIMLGLEIRWTALFFLFWLTLSLLYFGENVWPHAALFGLNIMLFFHGYDRYTLEGRFFKRRKMEPVL